MMRKAMAEQAGKEGNTQVTIEENDEPFSPTGFTGSYTMEIHSYKKGVEEKGSPMRMRMAITDEKIAMIPEPTPDGEVRMIHDLKERCTYTLMTDKKGERTGMKMKMHKVKVESKEPEDDGKVVRTEETKVIDGHTCRKYTFSDAEGSGWSWIAEDVAMDMRKVFGQMASGRKVERWQDMPYGGMLMETEWTSSDGNERTVMHTKDLVVGKSDPADFSTEGHAIQDLTAFPMPGR